MHPYRRVNKLTYSLSRWLTLAFIVFILSACGTTGTSPSPTSTAEPSTAAASHAALVVTPAATPTVTLTVTPVVTPAMTPLSNTIAWKTYRNDRAGYTVEYPTSWKITDRIESNGADVTTFVPPGPNNDGIGLTVIAQDESQASGAIPDMPNTRCQPVAVGKLAGTRCFDTIAFSRMTTLIGESKIYILACSGKRFDQNIYQHFLDSFALTA